ncbi:hypothetical protein [Campylobacter sp. 2014D-0216]|uniref:hypothetical protein n=1 Tax=Campylobacter sp. 2014D-0216 TaxID=1813595 RepID=UPI0018A65DA8|nr:hypothetical protein [Campylobacter sp. 2014D-0216]QOR01319.1 hypothetical protein A0083_00780 [Campylobacter sp. 2014D-0216]
MVKKFFLLFLTLVCMSHAHSALNKESYGEGFGATRSEAIKNAINEALGKTEGLRQVKLKKFEFKFNGNFNIGYDEEIDLISNGVFNSYDIQSLTQTSQNEFRAKVVIYNKLYNDKSTEDRCSLIIINQVKDELSAKFEQELLSVLFQTKKFKILDRADIEFRGQEKSSLIAGASDEDLIKLFKTSGADYLLILQPKLQELQDEGTMQNYNISINYRLISFSTAQIKASNTLEFKMVSTSTPSQQKALRGIATKITDDIFKYSQNPMYAKSTESIQENSTSDENFNDEKVVELGL